MPRTYPRPFGWRSLRRAPCRSQRAADPESSVRSLPASLALADDSYMRRTRALRGERRACVLNQGSAPLAFGPKGALTQRRAAPPPQTPPKYRPHGAISRKDRVKVGPDVTLSETGMQEHEYTFVSRLSFP